MKKAVMALIEKNGKYLAISRKEKPHLYGLIGGKVEDNETLENALIREAKEEIGVDIRLKAHVFSKQVKNYMVSSFIATYDESQPLIAETGLIIQWLSPEELIKNSEFSEYNRELLESLNKII